MKRFISETFNETGLVIGYRQPGFMVSPLSFATYCAVTMQAIIDTRTKIEDSPGKQTPNRVSLVVCQYIQPRQESEDLTTQLPLIDVDYSITEKTRLESECGTMGKNKEKNRLHIQAMKELKGSYDDCCFRLQSPRTLDESSYDFLTHDDLERRNQGQVLTVYLEGQKDLAEAGSSTPGLRSVNTRHGSMLSRPAVSEPRTGAVIHSLWKAIKSKRPATPSARSHPEIDDPIRPKMLMVPQLWLWKLDER